MSQCRIDQTSESMLISLSTLEKMSTTDTQYLLAENGLEKYSLNSNTFMILFSI